MAKRRKNKNSGLLTLALVLGAVYLFGRKSSPTPPDYSDPVPQLPIDNASPAAVVGTRKYRRMMPTTI